MSSAGILDSIRVDSYSATPKYLQLANSILRAIESGELKRNIRLPSLNELTCYLEISKETAEKGYRYLQELGVLNSIPGKGHYVADAGIKSDQRILLLLNKLSAEKKLFYDSFTEHIDATVPIDFYVYNNDFSLFKKLISNRKTYYSHYVIMPHFIGHADEAGKVISTLPADKLIVLDRRLDGLTQRSACIYEDFREDIYSGLEKTADRMRKYELLNLVFPVQSYFSRSIVDGFRKYCSQYGFKGQILNKLDSISMNRGEVYICLTEGDLVTLIEKLERSGLRAGEDVGIISYNETPLKKYILNGITTISTNYREMGRLAADMITRNYRAHVALPFHVVLRKSL
ncbi:substrate-binding domain-containing protein [Arcticibacter sp. MXS-1]|uniref:GntR family transcriptional regulator n=1 Tax=Arcticibacter sp. MXS-1 TaxID=3341726 RepID=UPI0035A948C5